MVVGGFFCENGLSEGAVEMENWKASWQRGFSLKLLICKIKNIFIEKIPLEVNFRSHQCGCIHLTLTSPDLISP